MYWLSFWSFVEKTSVKQSMKRQVCSNLADLPPPVVASGDQELN